MSESTNQMQGENSEVDEIEMELLAKLHDENPSKIEALRSLAAYYKHFQQYDKALPRFEQLIALAPDDEQKAEFQLSMGCVFEGMENYESAVKCYKTGIALKPKDAETWYLLHNNLGYSLNMLGQHTEAKHFCFSAIEINPNRHNAFKNLGISALELGMYDAAAECFVSATVRNPSDLRALNLLKALIEEQPQLREEFHSKLELCEQAVKRMSQ